MKASKFLNLLHNIIPNKWVIKTKRIDQLGLSYSIGTEIRSVSSTLRYPVGDNFPELEKPVIVPYLTKGTIVGYDRNTVNGKHKDSIYIVLWETSSIPLAVHPDYISHIIVS